MIPHHERPAVSTVHKHLDSRLAKTPDDGEACSSSSQSTGTWGQSRSVTLQGQKSKIQERNPREKDSSDSYIEATRKERWREKPTHQKKFGWCGHNLRRRLTPTGGVKQLLQADKQGNWENRHTDSG